MRVGRKRLRRAWDPARDAAGLDPRDCALFVVKGRMPRGGAEAGYFRPGSPDVPHEFMRPTVFRAVPPEVLNRYEHRHRVAIWSLAPRAPAALLEPLLRHELEHAAHWQRYGRPFTDLDGFLRDVWKVDGDSERYFELPSERACNDAAAQYAGRVLRADARERVRRARRYRQLVTVEGEPRDVLDATVEALRAAGDAFLPQFDEPERAKRLQSMEDSARNWPQDILEGMRDDEVEDIVVVRPYRFRAGPAAASS